MYTSFQGLGRIPFALRTSIVAILLGVGGVANAENPQNPITWNGITLYGTLDIGVSYQSHGRPQGDYYSAGGYTFPNKASTNAISEVSHNGLSQSTLGLRGEVDVVDGWSGVFKVESAVNPVTLALTDNEKALIQNNGKAITSQRAATDSSLTGKFSMALYAGVKSRTFGQLTYGRQNTPLKDAFYKYDPLANSAAFSAFGAYGTPAGGGSTEDARLNNALRYQIDFGQVKADALYAGPTKSQGGAAWQLDVGGKLDGLSVDGVIAQKKQAITAVSLAYPSATSAISVTQLTIVPVKAGYSYAPAGSINVNDALVGTVSDNHAWGLFAKYQFNGPVMYGGLEQITYANPSAPHSAGFDSIGGYRFAIINNGAYTTDKVLDVKWVGAKYPVTPSLDLMAAAYSLRQNTYTGNACAAPAATSPGTSVAVITGGPCSSGSQRSLSLAGVYKINTYFDLYAGIMASHLSGGMASGFVHSSVYNAMAGARLNF